MRTLKELKELNGRTFKKIALNMPTIEDIPEMEKKLKAELKEQGYDFSDWYSNDNCWGFGNQTLRKPKMPRESTGEVTFRSEYHTFTPKDGQTIYGEELKKSNVTDYGFSVNTLSGGEIQYYLAD